MLNEFKFKVFDETHREIMEWLELNLKSFIQDYGGTEPNYEHHITNISVNLSTRTLDVDTEGPACGRGCCGTESNYWNIPFDYILSEDFRKEVRQKTIQAALDKKKAEEEAKKKQEQEEIEEKEKQDREEWARLKEKYEPNSSGGNEEYFLDGAGMNFRDN